MDDSSSNDPNSVLPISIARPTAEALNAKRSAQRIAAPASYNASPKPTANPATIQEILLAGAGEIGSASDLEAVNDVQYVLRHAAENKMHVVALVRSINQVFDDRFEAGNAKARLSDLVRELLVAGVDVRFFVWNTYDRQSSLAPSFVEMLHAFGARTGTTGQLDIRFSGTSEHAKDVVCFLVATDLTQTKWLVRIEPAGSCLAAKDGVILFNTDAAVDTGKGLLQFFRKLENTADDRTSKVARAKPKDRSSQTAR